MGGGILNVSVLLTGKVPSFMETAVGKKYDMIRGSFMCFQSINIQRIVLLAFLSHPQWYLRTILRLENEVPQGMGKERRKEGRKGM